jgi:hypothetical protein
MSKKQNQQQSEPVRFNSYEDYLKSDKWKAVKEDYQRKEQTNHCLVCRAVFENDIKPNYHHFRYPKDWNNDSFENLIIVCESCHKFLHDEIEHNSNEISIREYLSIANKRRELNLRIELNKNRIDEVCLILDSLNAKIIMDKGFTPDSILIGNKFIDVYGITLTYYEYLLDKNNINLES